MISFRKIKILHGKAAKKLKKSRKKTCVLGDFSSTTVKFIWFFNEKRFQRNPKLYAIKQAFMGIHLGAIGLRQRKPGIEKV